MRMLTFVIAFLFTSSTEMAQPTLAAYLPDYHLNDLRTEQLRGLTDLILFSVRPDAEGHVQDPLGLLARSEALAMGRPGLRRLLSVGGGGPGRSEAFAAVAKDDQRRARFVQQLLKLLERHRLHGIDLDWERVEGDAQVTGYRRLVSELSAALSSRGALLTLAVADAKLLSPDVVALVDRVHLMAYDGPRHASLELARDRLDSALAAGVPARKLCLGIALYGLPSVKDGNAKPLAYRELLARSRLSWAQSGAAARSYRAEGPATVEAKVELARTRGLQGVFFWDLTHDAYGGDSLVELARRKLRLPVGQER